jgi:menaquinone-dependent protoporphyrinogen IX oxidase
MQILLLYGTNEGQTGKIAAFLAEQLARCGHQVTTASASDVQAPPDPGSMPWWWLHRCTLGATSRR